MAPRPGGQALRGGAGPRAARANVVALKADAPAAAAMPAKVEEAVGELPSCR